MIETVRLFVEQPRDSPQFNRHDGVRKDPRMQRRQFLEALAAAPVLLSTAGFAARSNYATTVTSLAERTQALYHDPELARVIADRLMAGLRAGKFAAAASPDQLAGLMNEEIQAAAHDMHFMVMSGSMGDPPVPPTPPHGAPPPLSPAELGHLRDVNFGIEAAEILPGNIARMAISQFYRPVGEVRGKIGHAMALLADSSAMIVDLSRCPGGDPLTVALFTSYFFDQPSFVLNRFRWRNRPVQEFRTETIAPGLGYGEQRPLIILISANTYSAGEEFAYNLQVLKRGVVVGRPSGGGANHALPVQIAGGFVAFIPQARAENPVTGTNWEGKGISPDITADPAVSARVAHRAALERVAATAEQARAALARRALAKI